MAVTTMAQASIAANGFYVPQFQILVQGAGLPSNVLRDVVEVTYKDKIDEIDSCELTVNNWDADRHAFKYIGSEDLNDQGQPNNPGGPDALYWTVFDPCNKSVELHLGYAGQLERMMIGAFTTIEPNFPASGPPVLQVRMLNRLQQLRTKKYSQSWSNTTDSAVAESIANARDPDTGQKRFPFPVVTDPNAKQKEPTLVYVIQNNQYDVDFLWQRARVNGYDVRIEGEQGAEQVVFGPSSVFDQPTYLLEWGRSLIEFKPTLTTANQYKSVTVRGWDRAAQKTIEEKVDFTDPELAKLNKNIRYLLNQCDPREEAVEELPVYTKDEARKRALSILSDQNKRMVRATGTTVGLPLLRAGAKLQLGKSVGSRLSGTYFVTATTHTFNKDGYVTHFEARREDTGSGS
ncbi:MAG TPA: hypothetical protein VIA18_14100 [Polyangia bacterium]|jgi:phage protein D|nr:hypothetical protein [Polyangia bacterium]